VQVCMHLGGDALGTNATFYIYNNTALSKFSHKMNTLSQSYL